MTDVYDSVTYDSDGRIPADTKIAVKTTDSGEVVQVVALGDPNGFYAVFTEDGKLQVTS